MLLAALVLALPSGLRAAEPIDLGPGVSDYQRFMAYPHLQRGFDAQRRGDAAAAVAAFERARRYAPRSATVALYLADAYRRGGRAEQADRLLAEQRRHTPGDARLAGRPVAASAPARRSPAATRAPVIAGQPSVTPAASAGSTPRRGALDREGTARLDQALLSALATGDVARAEALLVDVPARAFPEARFAIDLERGRLEQAMGRARQLLDGAPADAALLDRLTYRLVLANRPAAALSLLAHGWPFPVAGSDVLATRMATLVRADRSLVKPGLLDRLARPVDPSAIPAQVAVLASSGECHAAAATLSAAPVAPADAWLALADCQGGTASIPALRMAVERGGGDRASVRLANALYASGDPAGAVSAWKRISPAGLETGDLVAAAQSAVDAGIPAAAVPWLDEIARRHPAPEDAYWWLRSRSLAQGGPQERAAIERALAIREDARYLARLAELQRADGDLAGAVHSLERARALAPDDLSHAASLGYAYAAAARRAEAVEQLDAYRAAHPDDPTVAEDVAELEQRLARHSRAQRAARAALDALPVEADPDRRFRLRRLHEQLGRTWSLVADATLGDTAGTANANVPGASYRSYAQVQAERWLGQRIGRPDGDALAVYGRVFAGAQSGGILPDDLPTFGVGLRWKPFADRIVYVAVERQLALDARDIRRDDTLVRVSAAPLSHPAIGRDWHAATAGWWSHTVYLDAAHYLESGDSAATADYQAGRHFKLGQGATVEPFARIQWNGRWQGGHFDDDLRVGAGVRWNRWYGGSAYDAWPHRWVAGLEVQQALETYLPERTAVLLTVGNYW
ncbi:hypothetical protein GCM10008101_11280 [Lysobacter xinjiangensis]|uniref:Bacteriophage N4 adsorption protein A C-terminal domain-containing protein n=2 Tax=Cognatilysobacter xinjiangensis TaxID=546892 RepID=A0ABQ3BVQ1_9GAMM|nr:hypothetical protein GCM10008101_11280 [Lysobacter xinjiangensis]